MKKIQGESFNGDTIKLDGNSYEGCTFERCVLEYSAEDGVEFKGGRTVNCVLSFGGPAAKTIEYLAGVYSQFGSFGKRSVEELFDRIRRGDDAPQTPLPHHRKEFSITIRKDGVWHFSDKDEENVASTLPTDSDRSVALIAGSMIENRLKNAILLKSKHNAVIRKRVFSYPGPLGSFSAKIDLAYMLGLITLDAHHDLGILREIRNDFAHELDIRDFQSERIAHLTFKLRLLETHIGTLVNKENELIASFDVTSIPRMNVPDYAEHRKEPKGRYLLTIQLFMIAMIPSELPDHPLPYI